MTKEEQIKKMAKTLCIYDDGNSCCFRRQCDKKCKYRKFANALYEDGYRKISKNYAVTEEILRSIGYRPTEEVRKETARDILLDMIADILQLAQKYGVDIYE